MLHMENVKPNHARLRRHRLGLLRRGKQVYASALVATSAPSPRSAADGVVLSDIDDTFISSGGGAHGQDQRFEHGTIYPGAPEMYLELALGTNHKSPRLCRHSGSAMVAPQFCSQGVIWLSARAANTAIVKWFAGRIKPTDQISMALTEVGVQHGFVFGTSGGLYGKFRDNFSVKASAASSKAHTKYINLENFFAKRRADSSFFFLGDNGEGDEILAVKLLGLAAGFMKACFIHTVSLKPAKEVDRVATQKFEQQGRLIYYETYLGAATKAFARGYISLMGLVRVASAIFTSPYYTYCVIFRTMLTFCPCDSDSDSTESDSLETRSPKRRGIKGRIQHVRLHANVSKRLALLLEMKNASTKNYSNKQIIGQLVKQVGDNFWSWCVGLEQDELHFENVVDSKTANDGEVNNADVQAAVRCLRFRNAMLKNWHHYFLTPTIAAPSYDMLLKQTMQQDVQIMQHQKSLIKNLRHQLKFMPPR